MEFHPFVIEVHFHDAISTMTIHAAVELLATCGKIYKPVKCSKGSTIYVEFVTQEEVDVALQPATLASMKRLFRNYPDITICRGNAVAYSEYHLMELSVAHDLPAIVAYELPAIVAQALPALVAQALPALVAQALPGLIAQPSPALVTQPLPDLIAQPSPDLTAQPSPDLIAQPSPDLIAQPSPDLTAQPSPGLIAQPSPALVTQALPALLPLPSPLLVAAQNTAHTVQDDEAFPPRVILRPAQQATVVDSRFVMDFKAALLS